MVNKYKDFDAMFAEIKPETVGFKLFGKMYEIKRTVPAQLVLIMARQEKSGKTKMTTLIEAGTMLFGKKAFDEIMAHEDFTVDKLEMLIEWAFAAVRDGDDATDTEEEIMEDDLLGEKHSKN